MHGDWTEDELKYANRIQHCSKEDLYKQIEMNIKAEWENKWGNNSNKCSLNKKKTSVFDRNPALKFNRRDQVLITRLRIGHSQITHQHLINKEERKMCEKCRPLQHRSFIN